MSEALQTGQFYGRPQRKAEVRGVVLTEVQHPQGRKLPRHTHESAYFGLLLAGGYAEEFVHGVAEYQPLTIGFHPPGMTHRDEIGNRGSNMFTIELRESFLRRLRPYLTAPRFVPDLHGSEMTWLGLRLYGAFRRGDATELQVDSLCGEMLERAVSARTAEELRRPAWMARALELLRETFRETLTLEGLARELGVHPIHFSRVFRREQGCGVGTYVNRLRVQYACRELRREEAGLSEVARVCRATTGSTPLELRRMLQAAGPERRDAARLR
jgi:AraC family transcriptional regulator